MLRFYYYEVQYIFDELSHSHHKLMFIHSVFLLPNQYLPNQKANHFMTNRNQFNASFISPFQCQYDFPPLKCANSIYISLFKFYSMCLFHLTNQIHLHIKNDHEYLLLTLNQFFINFINKIAKFQIS